MPTQYFAFLTATHPKGSYGGWDFDTIISGDDANSLSGMGSKVYYGKGDARGVAEEGAPGAAAV